MNKMVSNMVDLLFQDVAESDETKALHDELMQNCQEHFQDLVDSGMSEDDAAAAVMESLSGMQEVVDQYPKAERKPDQAYAGEIPVGGAGETEHAEQAKQAEQAERMKDPTLQAFSAEGIERIRVDAGAHDVQVLATRGDQILVRCERPESIRAAVNGSTLSIETVRVIDEMKAAGGEAAEEGVRLMDLSLNELLGKVKNIVEKTIRTVADHINDGSFGNDELIEISVPESLVTVLEINASSGDLQVTAGHMPEVVLRTASGDVAVNCSPKVEMDRLFASSASGDIKIRGAYARRGEASAISGDVEVDGDFGELLSKSVSGDVDVDGTAVELQTKSVSGDVKIRLQQAPSGTVSAESTSGDAVILLPEDCAPAGISMASTCGEISCELPDAGADAPLQLRARTVSGDIRIEKM